MARSPSLDRVEWLVREGDVETAIPVSERIEVDDDYWHATIERIDLGPGIRLHLTQAEVRRPLTLEPHQEDPEPWLLSHMAVKGRVAIGLSDGRSSEIGPDRSLLFRPIDRRASFRPAPGQSLRLVGYMIRDDRVRNIFGDAVPDMLTPLIAERPKVGCLIPIPVSTSRRRLASTLFTTPLRGPLRTIFMEGVVLQLLAMETARATTRARPKALSHRERGKLEEARERLVSNMRCPPTVGELATAVGMSDSALNTGFRALFGGSVYEVLRDERLEHARTAIETTDAPVKQIAFRVGYNHVTNFISAFTARYGTSPARLRNRAAAE
jgi:AraC-like DNA-binding protein